MLSKERHNEILRLLEKQGAVTVSELSKRFGVSSETIRRDLYYMESKKLLSRVHGGAISPPCMSIYQTLEERLEENVDKKTECAQNAMCLLCEDDVIFIDSGSTAVKFAEVLQDSFKHMTVITHSIDVINVLRRKEGFRLITLGGEYNRRESANCGYQTTETIKTMHASKAVIFPVAVSLKYGVADQGMDFVSVQRAYAENSDETLIIADSSKFEKNSFAKLCDINTKDIFITDSGLSEEIYRAYREKNIRLFRSRDEIEKECKI